MENFPFTHKQYLDNILDRTKYYFSADELERISGALVVVAGLGASGSMVVELLTRWGVGKFRLLDMDKYDYTNINRQLFALPETVGKWKTEVATERIHQINPFASVEFSFMEKLNLHNAEALVKGADIVINATDTKSGFYLLHNFARKYKVPLIEGHGWRMTGTKVRVFDYRKNSQRAYDEPFSLGILNRFVRRFINSTKKPFEDMTQADVDALDSKDSMTGGSLGTTTSLVGAVIVTETIKLLSGRGKVLHHPNELYIDLFNMELKVMNKYSLRNIAGSFYKRRNEILKNFRGYFGRR